MSTVGIAAGPAVDDAAPRVRIWSLPHFVRLWVGESASAFGVAMSSVLLSLVAVVQLDASALWVIGYALVGMAVVTMNVIRQAWRQGYVPERLMARSATASQVLNVGLIPVAAVVAGALSGVLGTRPTIAAMCAITAMANLAILVSPVMGHRDLPEPVDTAHAPA